MTKGKPVQRRPVRGGSSRPRSSGSKASGRGQRLQFRVLAVMLATAMVAVLVLVLSQKGQTTRRSLASPTLPETNPASSALTNGLQISSSTESNLDRLAAERKNESLAAQWNSQANDFLKAGRIPEAVEAYKRAVDLSPTDEDLHFNLGIAYAKANNLTNAEIEYREALRLLPEYPEVHNNLGNILMRQGRIVEAERHFQESLKQFPEYAQAHNNMGILHQNLKQTNEALASFLKAVEYDTNYWEAHFNLASTYLRMNQRDQAIAELRETLRINPQFDVAEKSLAKVLSQDTNSPAKQP